MASLTASPAAAPESAFFPVFKFSNFRAHLPEGGETRTNIKLTDTVSGRRRRES
jgi:hypothetical protein